MAICRGSVSPSRSTSTGAFILRDCRQPFFIPPYSSSIVWYPPNLQSSSTKHARALVLGQVRGGGALVIGDLLLAPLLQRLARVSRIGIARDDNVFVVHVRLVGIIAFAFDVVAVFDEILGFALIEDIILRLVVVAVESSGQP